MRPFQVFLPLHSHYAENLKLHAQTEAFKAIIGPRMEKREANRIHTKPSLATVPGPENL